MTFTRRETLAAGGAVVLGAVGAGCAHKEKSSQGPLAAYALPDAFAAATVENVFARGGNAVDAAIAACFTLAVTKPDAGNIGGGGFATLFIEGRPHFLDFRETAPMAATPDMYVRAEAAGRHRPSRVGSLAAGTPGAVAGAWALYERFATKAWPDLLAPAIALARNGFTVSAPIADAVRAKTAEYGSHTNFADYFSGHLEGATVRQGELAAVLSRIAEKGPAGFYAGETARLIAAHMRKTGGIISEADLEAYRAEWRRPVNARWAGRIVHTAPPPSAGGVALVQLLKGFSLMDAAHGPLALNSADYVHLTGELSKRVFTDRARHLGDPDFVDVPVDRLIADDYVARRFADIAPDRLTPLAQASPVVREGADTTHLSIMDAAGNAVALTTTINSSYGSGSVVEGAGFLLNNEMDDFVTIPGAPNAYGLVGGEKNGVAPGRRMVSSMTPSVVSANGRVLAVAGAPGGSTIISSTHQAIVNGLHFGLGARESLDAPRFHAQLRPENTIIHGADFPLPPDVVAALEARGWRLTLREGGFGDPQLILNDGPRPDAASMRKLWREGVSNVFDPQTRPRPAR